MDSIRYMVHFMHCAFVAMEPQTGAVKAWVGDIDFKSWKYDKVTAMRQPGSTFKLFVYTEAMNQGLTPCDKRRDEYFSMQVFDKTQKQGSHMGTNKCKRLFYRRLHTIEGGICKKYQFRCRAIGSGNGYQQNCRNSSQDGYRKST